jgi:hypothetical protein
MEALVRTGLKAAGHLFGIMGLLEIYALWPEPIFVLEGTLYLSLAVLVSFSMEPQDQTRRRRRNSERF